MQLAPFPLHAFLLSSQASAPDLKPSLNALFVPSPDFLLAGLGSLAAALNLEFALNSPSKGRVIISIAEYPRVVIGYNESANCAHHKPK